MENFNNREQKNIFNISMIKEKERKLYSYVNFWKRM